MDQKINGLEIALEKEFKPNLDFLTNLDGEKCAEIYLNLGNLEFFCTLCKNLKFANFPSLNEHLFTNHVQLPNSDNNSANNIEKSLALNEEDPLVPTIAEGFLKTELESDSEEKFNDPFPFEMTLGKDEFSMKNSNVDVDDTGVKDNKCIDAKKKVIKRPKRDPNKPKRKGNWNRIYKTINIEGEIRYQCETCEKAFRQKALLRKHERLQHNYELSHHCTYCTKKFKTGDALKNHTRTHTGERPYKCNLCEKTFKNASGVANHKVYHTSERKFQCKYCEMKFYAKDHRAKHERLHTGERPFVCDVCGIHLISSGALSTHKIIHLENQPKPYVCEICNSSFLRKSCLKRHLRCHSDDRNFVCSICNASFKDHNTMVQHQKIHLDVNEYSCKICDLEFARYSRVRDHIKFKHGVGANVRSYVTYSPVEQQNIIKIQT